MRQIAQTVKVEIPIEAKDNTGSGVSSAQKRLTSLERAMAKMEKHLAKMEGKHDINIDANDKASEKITGVSADVDRLNGTSADVSVHASINDMATDPIRGVLSAADELDGAEAQADLEVNDMATDVITGAQDEVDQFDSLSGEADIEVDDMATDIVHGAGNEVENFGGMEANATIGATDEASAVIDNVSEKARSWGASAFTATIGVLGATVGVADTVDTYKHFQSTMSEVEAISGATAEQMVNLEKTAQKYGATTKFTATEAGEAFKYMAMAGWEVADMQAGIGGILSLAAASGEELGTTSDIVTDALTAFGYKADQAGRFSDVLAAASSKSNTNVAMMGETFKYVGTMAGTLGYEIEDVAVASGLMANAGIKSSMAGTSLNTILTRLSTNTNGARDAVESLGVAFYNQDGSSRPLIDVMRELRDVTADMTMEEQSMFANTVAGTTAQKGLNAILNASEEDWNKLTEAIYGADGAAGKMADTMMDNLEGSITLFQSALEGVKNSLGERVEPYLRTTIDGLTEALPSASDQINTFMNNFDNIVDKMKHSEEWQNANLIGKINISWDKLIAEPFTKWMSSKGRRTISSGIASMFKDALKILPGGESAGLTSWINAAIIGKGASKIIPQVGKIGAAISGLGASGTKLGMFGSTVGAAVPYVAAATAALVALGIAIDTINKKQIDNSLEEHFGKIKLSPEQVKSVANQILDAKWAVDIQLAVGKLEGADKLRKTAEQALLDNDALEYKNSVGIMLTAEETDTYSANIETFINSKIQELEARTYSAKIMVDTMLQTEEGQKLSAAISEWTLQDNLEMTNLSEQLREAVDSALSDGILSVDEQKHINELQQSINNIVSQWKMAESQAAMDLISQKYGSMSGKDLTASTFEEVITALRTQREANTAYLDEASTEFYTMLHAMENSGRLSELGLKFDALSSQWQNAIRNQEAQSLSNTASFETNTLRDTYGSLLSENMKKNSAGAKSGVDYIARELANGADAAFMNSAITAQMQNMYTATNFLSSSDQQALRDRFKQMKPDMTAMGELIDAYREQGQAIPKAFMDSYNETLQIGAASGDYDAAWGVFANQLKESGNTALLNGIMDGTIGAPQELRDALLRAMAKVTEDPLEVDDVTAKINGAEVTEESAEAIKAAIQNFLDTVDASGSSAEVTADGIMVSLGEVEVDGASAAQQIAEAIGITVEELASYNNYTVQEIEAGGVTIKIPTEGIKVNAEGLAEAIKNKTAEATNGAGSGDTTVDATTTVNQTLEDGTVVDNTTSAELPEPEPVEKQVPVNTTFTPGNNNASEIYTASQQGLNNAFAQNFAATGSVDVTINRASDNISENYTGVQTDLTSKFASGFSVSAPVSVRLNYSIANPSATVSLGGSASGSATVTASIASNATGNKIEGKTLSWLAEEGPEYVIPTTGRYKQRGVDLWLAAGQDLGMFDEASKNADGAYVEGNSEVNNPFQSSQDSNIWTTAGQPQQSVDTSKGETQTVSVLSDSNGSNNSFDIKVALNPTIKIESDGMDEQKVFEIIQSRIRELGDDIADEIAIKMEQAFGNMPLVQGV